VIHRLKLMTADHVAAGPFKRMNEQWACRPIPSPAPGMPLIRTEDTQEGQLHRRGAPRTTPEAYLGRRRGVTLEAAVVIAHQYEPRVRLVALEGQHIPIEHNLRDAFVRLLRSNEFTLGEGVERFEAESVASPGSVLC
jgi:hypothetical protein